MIGRGICLDSFICIVGIVGRLWSEDFLSDKEHILR